jgi:NAD(P)-dependent dehydrogenase (short-subunit alcohol dehydrogenase family)
MEHKAIIMTGAAHGFGRAIAQAFAQRGAIDGGNRPDFMGTLRNPGLTDTLLRQTSALAT